ncbi:FIVAR domain-containing protein [Mycoplasmoides gallisepticum]|uniref:FIVAR domain-containing protein n=1 Tax=Mycoplasmoides gallisepticum TaxID=2096 RepID=UPI0002778F65|nr:FIVAR domain-containing protein [Mycoplasmoides gallisepticum]AFP76370.1 variably expressed lipoprotein and hemagglutinin (VlhA) family protein [Mycoplasmoides gallisepticum VA94_7994-1-7P]
MKRKNILKFVSLLGIGSFVMLAAASCTSATTPTPNPEPKPDPMPNPPSGGMNGGDTNPGNGGGMDNSAQQLAAAKTALTTLLNTKSEKVGLYSDYAKIKDDLVKAYTAAKEISDKSDATLQEVNNAKTTLETAITTAASSKTSFDEKNPELIKAYNALKETLKNEETVLSGLTDSNFATIKTNLTALYQSGKDIVTKTLDPLMGTAIDLSAVSQANTNISNATSKLQNWKTNANTLATSFVKEVLVKNKLTGIDTTNNREQPGNYSFVGYGVDVTTGSNNARPNWSFAQRKVWTSETARNNGSTDLVVNPTVPTDVSWIYSLTGQGAKYTLEFNYYGPSTGYLYFPYKLVKESDKNMAALQYSLNGATTPTAVEFKAATETQPAAAGQQSSTGSRGEQPSSQASPAAPKSSSTTVPSSQPAAAASETTKEPNSAVQPMPETTTMNEAPTIDGINIAKVTLTDLKFGQNTLEFSVPSDKVAPMIGNMYITSNDQNQRKIYNEIFGNTSNDSTSVTVDLLKGYSLASGWSTYVGEFKRLTGVNQTASDSQTSAPSYLVGFIAGAGQRTVNNVSNIIRNPNIAGEQRTLAIYVNAPSDGQYGISGTYISNTSNRSLKFQTGSDDANSVTITVKAKTAWTELQTFNTSDMMVVQNNQTRTLHLKQGLNKIVISGSNDTPFIGNLTFTLNNTPSSNSES